jgi:hypothetical protein
MRSLLRPRLTLLSMLGLATGLILLNYWLSHPPKMLKPPIKTMPNLTPPTAAEALSALSGVKTTAETVKIGTDQLASVWFAQAFNDGKDRFYGFFIKNQSIDLESQEIYDSHVDAPTIAAVVYQQRGNHWQLDSKQLNLGELGSWGDVPEINFVPVLQLAPHHIAFLLESHFSSQGYTETGVTILAYRQQRWQNLGMVITGGDNHGACDDSPQHQNLILSACWEYHGEIVLGQASQYPDYPDLTVKYHGMSRDAQGSLTPVKNSTYRFDGSRYAKVEIDGSSN